MALILQVKRPLRAEAESGDNPVVAERGPAGSATKSETLAKGPREWLQ
jgi:hypothetical protein